MSHDIEQNTPIIPKKKGGRPKKVEKESVFPGFESEVFTGQYNHLPIVWIDLLSEIDNLAELKVVLYIMRHTWGFREYEEYQRLTIDEFAHGRRKKGRTRMDAGTGLSEHAVKEGIERAHKHGYIEYIVDDSDKARIKRSFRIKIKSTTQSTDKTDTSKTQKKKSNSSKTANARIQELQSMHYSEYLQTPEWQQKRKKALRFAGF